MISKSYLALSAGFGIAAFALAIPSALNKTTTKPVDPAPLVWCEEGMWGQEHVPIMAAEDFPRQFEGTYFWDGEQTPHYTKLTVADVTEFGEDLIVKGRGVYVTSRTASFTFEMRIGPDGAFEMVESEPDVADFVTDGAHSGRFDIETLSVRARWSDANQMHGTLRLSAIRPDRADSYPDRPHVRSADGVTIHSAKEKPCSVSWRQQVQVGADHVGDVLPLEEISTATDATRRALCVGDIFHTTDRRGQRVEVTVLQGEMPAFPVDAAAAPDNAEVLEGGVKILSFVSGDGERCVSSNEDRVTTHYTGWDSTRIFDSSYKRGRPATFKLTHVIKGWQTAVNRMCEGDYVRVWIPAELAYGSHKGSGRPSGDLVFDIELIDIAR